jgi:hypothetical protein
VPKTGGKVKNGRYFIDIPIKKKGFRKLRNPLNLFGGGERDRTDDLLAASEVK